ncbi:hypothetical protein V8E55_010722 [Tylopilus felleus]
MSNNTVESHSEHDNFQDLFDTYINASNSEWAPDDHEHINIDGIRTYTRWNSLEFQTKLKSTIYHHGLMPFRPIPGIMMFNHDQRHLIEWYTTWSDTFRYVMWHHPSADILFFFANGYIRQFLNATLKDTSSSGFFGIQEPYRNNQGEWKWRSLIATGDKALIVLSYTSGSLLFNSVLSEGLRALAYIKETLKVYSMELPSTFPRPLVPGLTFHYLSPQPSQPGCWSDSSANPITATERAALNEAMRKLIIPKTPVLQVSPEQRTSKLKEILQRKKWTIYQLASLQSHLEAHQSNMVEDIGLASEETTDSELHEDTSSDSTATFIL